MRRDLRHYELPSRFVQRYRPVRVHSHEKGVAAFTLDAYGLRFFRIMATGRHVPAEAIWSLITQPVLQLVSGRHENAAAYLVCEIPYASADPAAYPVPRRLSYRAKVTIAALQALLHDLADDPAASASANTIGFIERRIDQLRI